jgi:uncharacterized membrane protein YbhN (UPF0104 family)
VAFGSVASGHGDAAHDSCETTAVLKPHDHHEHPPDHPIEEDIVHALEPDERTPLPSLIRRWTLRLIPPLLLGVAAYALWREFRHLSFDEVAAAMADWGSARILVALLLSAVSFLLMGVVEQLGLRWTGARVPIGASVGTSFLANGIAHAVGANLLVAGAIRARLYNRFNVSLTQVAAVTLFNGMAFAVGLSTLGGLGMLLAGREELAGSAISTPVARSLGAALLAFAFGYVLLCALRRSPVHAFGRSLALPAPGVALAQLAVGVADNSVAAAIIWSLMPPDSVGYLAFVGSYAISCVAGLVSTVPAGAGVFEGSLSALLRGVEPAPLAAAFLGYRLAYYVLPLIVAIVALGGDTLLHRKTKASP